MDKFAQILLFLKERIRQTLPDDLDLSSLSGKVSDFWQQHKTLIIKSAIPVMLIGGLFYSCASSQRMVRRNIAEIFQISDEIRSFYSNKPDYWGLSTAAVVQQNMLSSQFLKKDKIVISGAKNLALGNGADGDIVMPQSSTFDVALSGLNKAQCISYVEADVPADNLVKLVKISILNNTGVYAFEWGGNTPLPVKKYSAKGYCLDTGNTVIWTLR